MLSEACVTLPWTEAATATVAAIVAALGTLAAKHRPAGARTRAEDRESRAADELADEDWGIPEFDVGEPLHGDPPPPSSRWKRAAHELRRPGDTW